MKEGKAMIPEEQETIIRFDESENTATVYSASKKVINRLKKAGMTPIAEDSCSATFITPKKCIKIKPFNRSINIGGKYTWKAN
jgi:hypothetical protein